jgi:hypothetical protein
MTLKQFVCKSTTRRDWYDWWIEDTDTGRELDRGSASKRHVAHGQARRALTACERRLEDGRPTELVEVEWAPDTQSC